MQIIEHGVRTWRIEEVYYINNMARIQQVNNRCIPIDIRLYWEYSQVAGFRQFVVGAGTYVLIKFNNG
jgi:hypothetical protein